MGRLQRRRTRKMLSLPEISLTPLIDTVLVLLVIFMVSVPVVQQAIKVNLPQAVTDGVRGKQEDVFVFIDKNKKLYINREPVTEDSLISEVKKKLQSPDQTVFMNADESLTHGEVVRLGFDRLKQGGIHRVAISTRRISKQTA